MKKLLISCLIIIFGFASFLAFSKLSYHNNKKLILQAKRNWLTKDNLLEKCQRPSLKDNYYQCFRGDFRRLQQKILLGNYKFYFQEVSSQLLAAYGESDENRPLTDRDLSELYYDLSLQAHRVVSNNQYLLRPIFIIEQELIKQFHLETPHHIFFNLPTPERMNKVKEIQFESLINRMQLSGLIKKFF